MRKRISFCIALAISLSINTICFAATPNTTVKSANDNTSITTPIDNTSLTLKLDEALTKIEKDNTELKLLNDKIDIVSKQYDNDHQKAISIDPNDSEVHYGNDGYASVKIAQDVTPALSSLKIDSAKNNKNERLNAIKFDLQRQYMSALTYQDQINNIKRSISNIDKQIDQTKAKIQQGQATTNALNSLEVQKSGLVSQINTPQASYDQALLNIKQYLNIDLNKELKLVDAKKDYVKFDDSDIQSEINTAVGKNFSLYEAQKNIDITKVQYDIYDKYIHNSPNTALNTALTLKDLQNKLSNSKLSLQISYWNAYYNLKGKEDDVQTQKVKLESAQMTYDLTKQKVDSGVLDNVQLDSAQIALDTQKNLAQRAINEYMITQEQFKYALEGHTPSTSGTMGSQTQGY